MTIYFVIFNYWDLGSNLRFRKPEKTSKGVYISVSPTSGSRFSRYWVMVNSLGIPSFVGTLPLIQPPINLIPRSYVLKCPPRLIVVIFCCRFYHSVLCHCQTYLVIKLKYCTEYIGAYVSSRWPINVPIVFTYLFCIIIGILTVLVRLKMNRGYAQRLGIWHPLSEVGTPPPNNLGMVLITVAVNTYTHTHINNINVKFKSYFVLSVFI